MSLLYGIEPIFIPIGEPWLLLPPSGPKEGNKWGGPQNNGHHPEHSAHRAVEKDSHIPVALDHGDHEAVLEQAT